MREAIHRSATSSNLEWDPLQTRDIDIITAMGLTDLQERDIDLIRTTKRTDDTEFRQLGGLLLCLKGATKHPGKRYFPGQDRFASDLKDAIAILVDLSRYNKTMRRASKPKRKELAALAITEWLHDACRACGGRLHIRDAAGLVVITCPECLGVGVHKYSDDERRSVLDGQHNDQLQVLHGLIGLAERVKVQAVGRMLEAW